jgi:N-acetylglutamate synthase-like GNAT family acetyltransferase
VIQQIRPTQDAEIERLFEVRAATRDNAISAARLVEMGITPETLRQALQQGEMHSWVGLHEGQVVGFCNVHERSGEVLVLAVQAGFEGQGLGRALLAKAVQHLREVAGCERIFLLAGADSSLRSHGFYRAQGWLPSGRRDELGDEELLLAVG